MPRRPPPLRSPAARSLAALAALGVLAACETMPGPGTGPATSSSTGVVSSEAVIPIRPAPEPLQTVQAMQSAACLQLGRPDDRLTPEYPAAAAKVRQEGWVRMRYDVENGQVVRPQVIASSPAGLFDEAIVAWARQLRYPSGGSASGCVMEYEYRLQAPVDAAPPADPASQPGATRSTPAQRGEDVPGTAADLPTGAPGPVPVPVPNPVPPPAPASGPQPAPVPPPPAPAPSPAPPPPIAPASGPQPPMAPSTTPAPPA